MKSLLVALLLLFCPLALFAQEGEASHGPLVSPDAPVLFHVAGFPVTNAIVYTWVVGILILVVVRLGTRDLKVIPSGLQNVIETAIEGLDSLTSGLLEPKVTLWVFPLVATFFIFIVSCNLLGLLPGVGSIGYGEPAGASSMLPWAIKHAETPLFRPPTADANTTCAMAAIFFVCSTYWALRYNGPIGLIKHIFGVKGGITGLAVIPLSLVFAFIGVIEVISILIRPVALAMRLYGNIYGGESVLAIMLHKAWGLPAVPFYFLEVVVAIVQALVFTLLSIAFISTLCSHSEDEGGGHKAAH